MGQVGVKLGALDAPPLECSRGRRLQLRVGSICQVAVESSEYGRAGLRSARSASAKSGPLGKRRLPLAPHLIYQPDDQDDDRDRRREREPDGNLHLVTFLYLLALGASQLTIEPLRV
jgi:hypothetical protein